MKGVTKGMVSVAAAIAAVIGLSGEVSASDWTVRIGGHHVDAKSTNHDVVAVESGKSLTFSATYRYAPRWGLEILAALPFDHDVTLNAGGAKVADVKHLPPTVSVQHYFTPERRVRPYLGVGLNATVFFDEDTTGPLAGNDLSLDTSFGLAAQFGLDVDIGENRLLGFDVRWIDIDSDAKLSGAALGKVEIDPLVLGVTFGWRVGARRHRAPGSEDGEPGRRAVRRGRRAHEPRAIRLADIPTHNRYKYAERMT